MFCEKCGAKVSDGGGRFCQECGTESLREELVYVLHELRAGAFAGSVFLS